MICWIPRNPQWSLARQSWWPCQYWCCAVELPNRWNFVRISVLQLVLRLPLALNAFEEHNVPDRHRNLTGKSCFAVDLTLTNFSVHLHWAQQELSQSANWFVWLNCWKFSHSKWNVYDLFIFNFILFKNSLQTADGIERCPVGDEKCIMNESTKVLKILPNGEFFLYSPQQWWINTRWEASKLKAQNEFRVMSPHKVTTASIYFRSIRCTFQRSSSSKAKKVQ